jgi:hypothetical protein
MSHETSSLNASIADSDAQTKNRPKAMQALLFVNKKKQKKL